MDNSNQDQFSNIGLPQTNVLGTPPSDTPLGSSAQPINPVPSLNSSQPLSTGGDADKLQDIKTQALAKLTPLIKSLDQKPEEHFRTTMMLIQASDNKDLIKEAYETALTITDEKARAQALLDIVNEINYFTQGSED